MPDLLRWLLDTSSCVGDPACLLQPTDQSILLHALPFAATFFLPPRPTGQLLPVSFGWRCNELGQRPSTIELYTSPDGAAYDLHATIHGAAADDGVLHRVSIPPLAAASMFFRIVVLLDGSTRDARRATAVVLSEVALVCDGADGATSLSAPHADSHPEPYPRTVSSTPSALPTYGLPPLPPPQPRPPTPHPPPRAPPISYAQWPPPLPARTLPRPWDGGTECRLQLVQHAVHNATLLAALQRQVRAHPIGASWRLGPRGGDANHTHASTAHTRTHARLSPTHAR